MTYLSASGEVPSLRKISNNTVVAAIGSQFDNREMTIHDILEHDVKFASMVVGYKVYQSSKQNFVFGTTIYTTYQMLKEDKRYDLCTVLLNELLSNLKKIKQDKNHTFKFGTLIICLALYFMNEIPDVQGKVQWAYDKLVAMQIKEGIMGISDGTMRISQKR